MVVALHKEKLQAALLRWFKDNARDLPWRKTSDPYAIWVSEIMLQQTQVATVIPYYQRFLKSFPTVRHLAKAELSPVLKRWEGLGYYSRARNLRSASRVVLDHFGGRIPDNLKDLLSLPGIGKYTAGAILSIAYNKEAPILDGNVKRVLSRLLAVSAEPRKAETFLWKISESLIPKGFASSFNQALMDLGSMVCTPKDPQCPECPIRHFCKGEASGNPGKYPSKIKRRAIPHFNALSAVILKDKSVLLRQRPAKGLLGGLWEFPNWRTEEKGRLKARPRIRSHIKKELGMNVEVKESVGTFKQTFTHFKLTLKAFRCETMDGRGKGKWVAVKNLNQFAMSKIHRRIAQTISDFRL